MEVFAKAIPHTVESGVWFGAAASYTEVSGFPYVNLSVRTPHQEPSSVWERSRSQVRSKIGCYAQVSWLGVGLSDPWGFLPTQLIL